MSSASSKLDRPVDFTTAPQHLGRIRQAIETADIDGDLQAWSLGYLENHWPRYLSDLEVLAGIPSAGEMLEIGGAPFHMSHLLKLLGCEVSTVDLAPERFEALLSDLHLNVVAHDIEGTEPMPFADGQFQLIWFAEVFEHLRIHPLRTLRSFRRVLSDEGRMVLTTPNLYALPTLIRFVRGHGFDNPFAQFDRIDKIGHMGHVREYTTDQVGDFLRATGFEVESVQMRNRMRPRSFKSRVIHRLMERFEGLRTEMVIVARAA